MAALEKRQAIFAQYLKKKADHESGEVNEPTASVPKRCKPKSVRPKSQPPPASCTEQIAMNSQEEMYGKGFMDHGKAFMDLGKGYLDHDMLDSNFVLPAFGNLTQRRPPSPG